MTRYLSIFLTLIFALGCAWTALLSVMLHADVPISFTPPTPKVKAIQPHLGPVNIRPRYGWRNAENVY
jgi:uncharacterized membrane protein YciS (DUF1049 family)